MSDTFSNPGNASYFADLGLTNVPLRAQHGTFYRPHPIFGFLQVLAIPRGQTGWGIKSVADFSAAIAFSENTALTDQAMPTITSANPTLGGRGFSYSQTVQGRNRVADDAWKAWEKIRDQKVARVLLDDLSHLSGNSNSIIALTASVTDITRDANGNASLDGLLDCLDAVGRPAVAFYDLIGLRGLVDSIRAEGGFYTNDGLADQVRRMADKFTPDQIADDGFAFELFGCRVYVTNERSGDATRLYETGSVTHAIVMRDFRRTMAAGRQGGPRYQYDDVVAPIVLQGRANAIPDLPRIHEPNAEWLRIESPDGGEFVAYASWFDIGNNVAGHKRDFGGEFDPILANSGYIRAHQYLTAYQS